jgi:lipid-binding SYLF domain-containing protein
MFKKKGKTMKPVRILLLALCALFMAGSGFSVLAGEYDQTLSVFRKSPVVQPFFDTAYGYAVFPTIGKGGIAIVGGAYGKGRVYRQGSITGHVSLSKVSVGPQLGGQAFSEIIFFQDQRAYEEFTSGRFEFDASMSAVVITAGAQAKAGTEGTTAGASAGSDTAIQAEISYTKGLAVFIHTKGGLMYEAAIGGQKFDFTPL